MGFIHANPEIRAHGSDCVVHAHGKATRNAEPDLVALREAGTPAYKEGPCLSVDAIEVEGQAIASAERACGTPRVTPARAVSLRHQSIKDSQVGRVRHLVSFCYQGCQ